MCSRCKYCQVLTAWEEGAHGISIFIFSSFNTYASFFIVSLFVIFLLRLLPVALALMKGVNLLIKWPAYLGSPNRNN